MTLTRLAFKTFGPIDAAINLVLNTAIPWLCLRNTADIAWFGMPSAFCFFAPMAFCVGLFPTYFGIRNGVIQRNHGLGRGPLPQDFDWSGIGWWWGYVFGLAGLALATAIFLVVHRAYPNLTVPSWTVILADGLIAAVAGYGFQVYGVLKANRL